MVNIDTNQCSFKKRMFVLYVRIAYYVLRNVAKKFCDHFNKENTPFQKVSNKYGYLKV